MSDTHDLARRIDGIRASYQGTWDHLRSIRPDRAVTLINLFAFRDVAEYDDTTAPPVSGRDAFDLYAAVSGPALEGVGGRFVHVGSHRGNVVGDDEKWDLVVIGEYPDLDALLRLHENPAYREAYRHRNAACARQRVLVSG